LTLVANPNSPSGRWCPTEELIALAGRIDGVLVLDEAYADFAGDTAIPAAAGLSNVVVVRTFSKSYSLAGLRVGYLVAAPEVVSSLEKVSDSYPCDSLSIAGGVAAIDAAPAMRERVKRVVTERERLAAGLVRLGFEVVPSAANFLFCRAGSARRARGIFEGLRSRGILIRYFGDDRALDDGWRITVGTAEEVDRLLAELEEIVREESR
jgi:histidinol-phosphate aminotransferase